MGLNSVAWAGMGQYTKMPMPNSHAKNSPNSRKYKAIVEFNSSEIVPKICQNMARAKIKWHGLK